MEAWEYALELKAELEQWWVSAYGQRFSHGWEVSRSQQSANTRVMGQAGGIAIVELQKLPVASVFFVTDEMTDLLEHAAKSFPNTPLHPTDIMVDRGFVLFGRKVDIIDIHLKPLPMRALTWATVAGGIHIAVYAHKADEGEIHDVEKGTNIPVPEEWATLSLLHDTFWAFGENYADDQNWGPGTIANEKLNIPPESMTSAILMMKTIHCFFMLCQQRIGEAQPRQASRGARRRIERSFPNREIPDVRVITLRRRRPPRHEGEEVGSGREYSHRWWVNGFWRRQWYPSEDRHKPRYIEGHIRGPEDKPFQAKDTAYIWRR